MRCHDLSNLRAYETARNPPRFARERPSRSCVQCDGTPKMIVPNGGACPIAVDATGTRRADEEEPSRVSAGIDATMPDRARPSSPYA